MSERLSGTAGSGSCRSEWRSPSCPRPGLACSPRGTDTRREAVSPSPSLHALSLESHFSGLLVFSPFVSDEGVAPARAAQGLSGTCNEVVSLAQRAAWKGCTAQTLLFSYRSYCSHEKGREGGTCVFFGFFFQFIRSREAILGDPRFLPLL